MSRITTLLCVPVVALSMALLGDAPAANAGGFSITVGSGGYGYGGYGYGNSGYRYSSGYRGGHGRSGYNNGHRAFGPTVHPRVHSRYRSGYRGYTRPHYDYHAPSLVPHGNHYHYQPGHYDKHYGGHGHHRH